MKKNTKKFITSIVALSMAFSSVVTTSVAVSAADDAVVSTDDTASGSAVEVVKNESDDNTAAEEVASVTLAADYSIKFGTDVAAGDYAEDSQFVDNDLVRIVAGGGDASGTAVGVTVEAADVLTKSGNVNADDNGSNVTIRPWVKITPKADCTIVANCANIATNKAIVLATAGESVTIVESFEGTGKADAYTFATTLKAGTTYLLAGKGTNAKLQSIDFTKVAGGGEENPGGGEEEPTGEAASKAGNATLTPEKTSYTFAKDSEVVVKYTFKADETGAINNITGFFTYDPKVALMTKTKMTITTKTGSTATTSFDKALANVVNAENAPAGYTTEEIEKGLTEAELGKVKLARVFTSAMSDSLDTVDGENVEATQIDFELTFNVVGDANSSTPVTFEQYKEKTIRNAANQYVDVAVTPTEFKVASDEYTTTKYSVTTNLEVADGAYLVPEDTDEFFVAVTVEDAVKLNNITAALEYDPTVIEAVESPEGFVGINTALLPASVINEAIAYVPTSANTEFKGADGVKTAAKLGKLKLANLVLEEGIPVNTELAKDETIAVIKFKKIAKGKETTVKFTNIQSTDADLHDIVPLDDLASVKVKTAGTATIKKTYHLLGDVDHSGSLTAMDATKLLDLVNGGVEHAGYDEQIGDVMYQIKGKFVLDATDATKILDGVNSPDLTLSFTDRKGDDILDITSTSDNVTRRYTEMTAPEGVDWTKAMAEVEISN